VDCRAESATTGEGRFRVNANGNLLDVWLLVRCVSCDRTSKLTVHERAPVRSFDPAELHGYRVNDPELVAKFPYLKDALTAIETADTIPTSLIPEFFQLNDVMNVEFNAALIGTQDAKSACEKVQTQWEAILRKAGHLA